MYKVLVTNDDGINAEGIRNLIEALSKFTEVYVVAPAVQQSTKSHSITLLREFTVREVEIEGTKRAYAVEGTPADCVKWGIKKFENEGIKIDYVLSGINHGGNCGAAAYYSGTISAAMEGSLNGIRSIALSVQSHGATHFEYVCGMLENLLEMSKKIPASTILSVNAPDIPVWQVKGIRIVRLAPYDYGEAYALEDPGDDKYMIKIDRAEPDPLVENDYNVMTLGYVAISPISFSLNDELSLMKLQGLASAEDIIAVFIDSQEKSLEKLYNPEIFDRKVTALANCISRLDIPAVVANEYGLGNTIEGIQENIVRSENVVKSGFNAWKMKDFESVVSLSGARKIIIAGTETHTSVLQTAEEAIKRGYEVTIIEDCCGAVSQHEHRIAVENLRTRGCRVATLESEMLKITEEINHSAINKIMKILAMNENVE